MKKRFITTILVAFALAATVARAQKYNGTITASDIGMSPQGAEILLNMTLDIEDNAVSSAQSVAIIPTLSDGIHEATFPYILVNGKERNRIYERQLKFDNHDLIRNPPKQVMVIDRKHRGGRLNYSGAIANEQWMADADLSLRYVLISPAGERQTYTTNVASTAIGAPVEEIIVVPEVPEQVEERLPEEIAVVEPQARPREQTYPPVIVPDPVVIPTTPSSNRQPRWSTTATTGNMHILHGTAYLDFEAASSAIEPYYKRNPQELNVISQAMGEIMKNPQARITSISITGYASPEGSVEGNRALAHNRAMALARYLQNEYSVPISLSKVIGVGEDWNGLMKMVAMSSLPYLDRVIGEMSSTEHPDVKEAKMRKMMAGQIWQRMSYEMFPDLRRVEYKIEYRIAE